jgi:hypothetical protein
MQLFYLFFLCTNFSNVLEFIPIILIVTRFIYMYEQLVLDGSPKSIAPSI